MECLFSVVPARRLPLSLALAAPEIASHKPKGQLQLWPILYSAPKWSKTKYIPFAPTPPYEIADIGNSDFVTPLLTPVQCIEPEEVMACCVFLSFLQIFGRA